MSPIGSRGSDCHYRGVDDSRRRVSIVLFEGFELAATRKIGAVTIGALTVRFAIMMS